jgi:hypothetical protein
MSQDTKQEAKNLHHYSTRQKIHFCTQIQVEVNCWVGACCKNMCELYIFRNLCIFMWVQQKYIYTFSLNVNSKEEQSTFLLSCELKRALGLWVMCCYFCANKVFQWFSSSFVFGFLCDFRRRTRVEKEHLEHMAH